jgi:HEAT repeat protein
VRGWLIAGLLAAVAAAAGCGKSEPPLTAGGRPVSHWLDELKKPDPKARKKAVRELGHVGPADPAAIPAVTAAVKDKDAAVRREAVLALLNLGPAARDAAAALAEAAKSDPDPAVRQDAAKALERIRGGG